MELSRVVCDEQGSERVFRDVLAELQPILGLEEFSWMEGEDRYEAFACLSQWQYVGINAVEELDAFQSALGILANCDAVQESIPASEKLVRRHLAATLCKQSEVRATLVAGCLAWCLLKQRFQLDAFPRRVELLRNVVGARPVELRHIAAATGCEAWWVRSWASAEPRVLLGHTRGRAAVAHLPSIIESWPDVVPACLNEITQWARNNNFVYADVRLHRLRADSNLEYHPTEQGMRPLTHTQVVNALKSHGRAMGNRDLSAALGQKIRINPLSLPPGRVLAYGKHEKFYSMDGARFVLRDWVQTARQRKGRISPDRLITPLSEKNCKFSEQLFGKALGSHEPYKYLGLVFSPGLTLEIASMLQDRPTDLYHLGIIRKDVDRALRAIATRIDSGFYACGTTGAQLEDSEVFDQELIAKQTSEKLQRVADPTIQNRLLQLLGRSPILRISID
jgi:hypothetical protein